MSDFAIVTDTAAELLEELSVKLDIHMIPMEFTMSGVSYQHDAGYRQMDAKTFYRRLRDGRDGHHLCHQSGAVCRVPNANPGRGAGCAASGLFLRPVQHLSK